jgi:hypothetical protein
MTPRDLAILASLLCLGCFCAGMACGLWRRHRLAAAQYRLGREAGFNEARAMYSRTAPDVPTIRPRVAPFAGREPPH